MYQDKKNHVQLTALETSQHLATNDHALCPARRLPDDVLAKIFVTALEHEGPPSERRMGNRSFMLVCHEWYTVSRNTPYLWTAITYTPFLRMVKVKFSKLVEMHITLSGALPLHIYMWSDFPVPMVRSPDHISIWDMLVAVSHRWISFTTQIEFLNLFEGELDHPMLEYAKICATDSRIPIPPLACLKRAPQLKYVHLDVPWMADNVRIDTSPCRLTRLSVRLAGGRRARDTMLDLLRECSASLREFSCIWEWVEGEEDAASLGPPLLMPALECMKAATIGHRILACLAAPALKRLVLDVALEPWEWLLRIVRNGDAGRSLRELDLGLLTPQLPTLDPVLSILRELDALDTFRICDYGRPWPVSLPGRLVEPLTCGKGDEDGRPLLPNLRCLHTLFFKSETTVDEILKAFYPLRVSRAVERSVGDYPVKRMQEVSYFQFTDDNVDISGSRAYP
ncbi:hypothetical protein GGG16DRAFT_46646 [Schizophyllum commune]